jgi:hypothetical protein
MLCAHLVGLAKNKKQKVKINSALLWQSVSMAAFTVA